MLSARHVSLDKGISSTSKKWRFYVVIAAYPSLLAKLKLSCLCALLRGLKSAHKQRYNSYLPFFTSKIKVFL